MLDARESFHIYLTKSSDSLNSLIAENVRDSYLHYELYHNPQISKVRDTLYCARSTLDIMVQVRLSMVCAPVRSIIPSLKLGDYLSVQAHKPCSISH